MSLTSKSAQLHVLTFELSLYAAWVFIFVGFDKQIEYCFDVFTSLGDPGFRQCHFWLSKLWQLVKHVRRLVYPQC